MGGGGPIKKIKKLVDQTPVEKVAKFGINPFGAALSQLTGEKVFASSKGGGLIAGEAGEKFVDKPKEFRRRQRELADDAKRTQQEQLKKLRQQKVEEEAQKKAGAEAAGRRRSQARKQAGTGRGSTILTEKLGGTAGGAQRKTLIGS